MLKIGLTGGIASGKSTVASFFSALGAPVIDADIIAREVIGDHAVLAPIIQHFGQKILDDRGQLNRSLLRAIIFENGAERIWLENLLHPIIIKQIHGQISELKAPYCIIVIPLLIEATQPYEIIDRILVVDASESMQIERTQARDQIALALIHKMLESQASRAKRCASADEIINNDGDLPKLKQKVEHLHQYYLQLARENQ